MAKHGFVGGFILACMMAYVSQKALGDEYPKLSPYPSVRWSPEVWVDGRWQDLVSIDGVATEEILSFARGRYEGRAQKRFAEDLVEVLSEMGRPPGKVVTLVVRDAKTAEKSRFGGVALTEENRWSVMELEGRIPLEELTAAQMRKALDDFNVALDQRWSYRRMSGIDFDAAAEAVREKIDAGLSPDEFGIELQKVIALGIDGHAEVAGYRLPSGGCLPFLVESEGERFVAFKADRTDFLAAGFPYIDTIDGRPVAEWLKEAAALVPKGSPQYVRRHCLRGLRELDYLRGTLGLPKLSSVRVEVASANGNMHKTLSVPVAERAHAYGVWPPGGSRLLEGNVGYLRLSAMDEAAVREIRAWMPQFRETTGLVIDVRDNGGGSREPLRLLYSYLAHPDDPPRVFTAAAYRLHPAHGEDYLAQRFMFRAYAAEWTAEERQAVAAFARSFKPVGMLPGAEFSEWHYMALRRADEPGLYHYDRPVMVLMNAKCFSATDVFLAGLKGMKRVTLIGMPSSGGSALAQEVSLGETPLTLRIGSMVSFQADGTPFDGHGVAPDVLVEAAPEYHVARVDNVLLEATRRLAGRTR